MEKFEKEIGFLSKILNSENVFELQVVKKVAVFNELDATIRDQHKLHFKIVSLFTNAEKKEDSDEIELDSDTIYDLSVKSIKQLLVVNDAFTASDKTEFLNDSGAIFNFGYWLLGEKINPFFSKLMTR